LALLSVFDPVSGVLGSVEMGVAALAVALVQLELALVEVAILINQFALS
jgi:hypothetical protein